MIKILLIGGVIAISVMVGVYIKNYLLCRYQIFSEFKNLLQSMKLEISFLKTDKRNLLKKYNFKNKHLRKFVIAYSDSRIEDCIYLNRDENIKLYEILESIGKNDVEGELRSIDYYENIVFNYCNIAYDNLNKYGNFSIKLAIILGTLIAIIMI